MLADKINNSFDNIPYILFRSNYIGDTDILSVNKDTEIHTFNKFDILRSDKYALILPSLYSVSITEEINNYINKADIMEVSDSISNKIISDINYQLDSLIENNKYTKKYIYYYNSSSICSNIIISKGLIYYKASIALIDGEC